MRRKRQKCLKELIKKLDPDYTHQEWRFMKKVYNLNRVNFKSIERSLLENVKSVLTEGK